MANLSTENRLEEQIEDKIRTELAKQAKNTTYSAEVIRVDSEGTWWVRLPGNESDTPVIVKNIDMSVGDIVSVTLDNDRHITIADNNISNPPWSGSRVQYVMQQHEEVTAGAVDFVKALSDFGVTADSINRQYGYFENLEARNLTVDNLQATRAYIKELEADNVTAQDIKATYGYIEELEANDITTETITATTGYIEDLTSKNITTENIEATTGYIEDLTTKNITTESIEAVTGYIGDLTSNNITAQDIRSDHATITSLDSTYATIVNLDAAKGRIDDLESTKADISVLRSDYATLQTLTAGYAEIDLANVNNAWIQNGAIRDAAIGDAQIIGVSANKLTAGTIDANKINVANLRAKNLIVEKLNGQPILGGYELIGENMTGYSSKNPKTEGWYEYAGGSWEASADTSVQPGKVYYRDAEQVALYDQSYIDGLERGLNQRIDGAVETFTGTAVPTMATYPAADWTSAQYASHVGDIYYVVDQAAPENGYCYRFAYDSTSTSYGWVLIKDSDVTKALSDITDLQTFRSDTISWQEETDEGLRTIRQNHSALSGVVDKTVKSSVQLWFTKANTTAPAAPTSQVTVNNASTGNAWNLAVPTWNASYPNYFYCWQYLYADGTCGWSAVVLDVAMGETQSVSRANIKSSVMLWFTKANSTAPAKPTAQVTTNNAATGNAWNIAVPTYNASYPHYFYCYQQQLGSGFYQWTDVVYDRATSEAQSTARATSSSLASYISSNDAALQLLQDQVDGAVDIWYGTADPVSTAVPEKDWAAADKDMHVGDLYYNTTSGHAFRYVKSGSSYSWSQLPDTDAAAALAAAQDAQATADGKRRIFTSQPTVPYDVGDLWAKGSEVMYANKARSSGSYTASEWSLTATDDTMAKQNVKATTMLWFTKANATAPAKPTSKVTSTSTGGNAWTTVVPTWSASYPHYYYCYQFELGDGSFRWDAVVYDRATSEAQQKAAAALPASTFTTFQSTTFKELVDEVDEQSSTITTMSERVDKFQVGGRNLLRGTADSTGWYPWNNNATVTKTDEGIKCVFSSNNTGFVIPLVSDSAVEGDTDYMLSFDYRGDVSLSAFSVYVLMRSGGNLVKSSKTPLVSSETEWQHVSFPINWGDFGGRIPHAILFPYNSTSGKWLEIRNASMKLERGTIATDWTPAPEDVDASITTVSQTVNSVKQTADSNSASLKQVTNKIEKKYATCSTAAGTQAKTATLADFSLYNGADVYVKFSNANTVSSPTLNVNSTGAKPVKASDGSALTTEQYWKSGETMHFVYDGTNWLMQPGSGEVSTLTTRTSTITQTLDGIKTVIGYTESTSGQGSSTLVSKVNEIDDTVDGHTQSLKSVTETQASIQKSAVKSTVQLWFTKANTTAPNKPTAHVTANNAATANAWNLAVPTYSASYPNYYYCYEYQYVDGSYGWSAVTRDIATGEMQERARTAVADAASAQATADKNVKESAQLWFTKANATAPAKPTSSVTSTSTGGNAWTTRVPAYSASYPHYFYCMQYKLADGTATWSDVVYDQATTEAQSVARTASANLTTLQQDYATFKQTTQQFESTVGSTYATKSELSGATGDISALEAALASKDPFIVGTQTAATYDWKGECDLAELKDGQSIRYALPYSIGGTAVSATYTTISSGATTNTTGAALTLTLADGTSTGQVPVWYGSGMSRVTSHYAYGAVIPMTYRENVVMGGTYKIAKGWFVDAEYNSDNVYSRSITGGFYTGKNGVLSYGLCMRDENGRWTAIVNNKYSNTTQDKTAYTGGLDPSEVLYCSTWYANGRVATDNTSVSGDLWASNVFDFRYCTNISANSTAGKALTVRKPVYLVGTLNANGLFVLDPSQWWTQAEPTSADGKVYVYLGTAYSWYQLALVDRKPMYEFANGKFQERTRVIESRVSTAETSIQQNRDAIALRATKTEAYQAGQPNLSPYFSYLPLINKSAGSPYWYYLNGFTAMEDGWAKGVSDNTSGTATTYINMREQAISALKPSTVYTAMLEVRNYSGSGTTTWFVPHRTASGQLSSFAAAKSAVINGDGIYRLTVTTLADLSNVNEGCSAYIQVNAGAKISLECRMSLYEGEYTGPYKPYSGSQLYASQSELKVTADGITSTVSKKADSATIISTINQSAESVKVAASKVEIDGAAIFSNSAFKAKADAAYDAKGAASSALTGAKAYTDALEVGGRNLIRNGNFACATPTLYWAADGTTNTVIDDSTFGRCLKVVQPAGKRIYQNNNNGVDAGANTHIAGRSYALSFYAKADAAGTLTASIAGNVGSDASKVYLNEAAVTTSWARYDGVIESSGVSGSLTFKSAGAALTFYIANVMLVHGTKPVDFSPAPEDVDASIADAKKAGTDAQATANAAAPKTSAVKRTQRIWYRSNSATAPSTPGTASSNWVTKADDGTGAWTRMHVAITSTHKYIYTCEQYELASGTVGYTGVLLDNTITVIDGGNIITGTVTASKLNAADINAQHILTVGAMTTDAANSILNSNVKVGGKNLALNSDATSKWTSYNPTSYEIARIPLSEDFVPGEEYTVTVWGGPITRSDKSSCWYSLYWGGGNFNLGSCVLVEAGVYRGTFTVSATNTAQHTAVPQSLLIYNTPGVGASGTTYSAPIDKVKVERGNVGTGWTPAPEETSKPNLAPFFSFEPYNVTAGLGGQYWQAITYPANLVSMGDGWVKYTTRDNTSGTAVAYDQHRPKSMASLDPETTYTLMVEFRNVSKTGGVYLRCPDGGQSGSSSTVQSVNGAANSSIDLAVANGTYYKVFSTSASSAANYASFFGLCTKVDAGAKATYEMRLSIYEGVYYGPYQTYAGHAVVQEQRIYYRSNSTSAPAAPTAFVTSSATANATWTTKRMPYDQTYKHLYTTMQRKYADGTTSCGTVLLDDTITVIDGGNIITGSIDANKIKVSEIKIGDLSGYSALNGNVTDAAKTATNYISADSSGIRIASANPSTQNQRLQLTSSRIDFYNANNVSIGAISGDTARFGKLSHTYVNIDGNDGNVSIYKGGYLKANYADTITLYGGSNANGAGGKMQLDSSNMKFIDANNKTRLWIDGNNMVLYDKNGGKSATIDENGMTIWKVGSKRAATTANGLDVYGSDGTTSVASFGQETRVGLAAQGHIELGSSGSMKMVRGSDTLVDMGSYTGAAKDAVLSEAAATGTAYPLPADFLSIVSVMLDDTSLANGTDYSVSGGKLTLKASTAVNAVLGAVDEEGGTYGHALNVEYTTVAGLGVKIGGAAARPGMEVSMPATFTSSYKVYAKHGTPNYDAGFYAERTDTVDGKKGSGVAFCVGTGGINHGVWSVPLNRWLIHANRSNLYLLGGAIRVRPSGFEVVRKGSGLALYLQNNDPDTASTAKYWRLHFTSYGNLRLDRSTNNSTWTAEDYFVKEGSLGALAKKDTAPVANGGTGATTAAAARTNLGLGSLATKSSLAASDIPSLTMSKISNAGTLATKSTVALGHSNVSTTSPAKTLAGGAGMAITWTLAQPDGYEFAGIYHITTSHNQACSIGQFNYSSSNNQATVVVTNRSTTQFTDLTATMSVHFVKVNVS